MKKAINLLSVVVLMAMVFSSCTKFEEGSGFSLKSKKGRLCRAWTPTSYEDANGNTTTASSSDGIVTYDKDGTMSVSSGSFSFEGTWEFVGDDQIKTTFVLFGTSSSTTSTFVLLTSKELGVMDSNGNKSYFSAN